MVHHTNCLLLCDTHTCTPDSHRQPSGLAAEFPSTTSEEEEHWNYPSLLPPLQRGPNGYHTQSLTLLPTVYSVLWCLLAPEVVFLCGTHPGWHLNLSNYGTFGFLHVAASLPNTRKPECLPPFPSLRCRCVTSRTSNRPLVRFSAARPCLCSCTFETVGQSWPHVWKHPRGDYFTSGFRNQKIRNGG